MSDAVSALAGATQTGAVSVTEAGLQGMVTLKADLDAAKTAKVLKAIGPGLPGQREIVEKDGRAVAWMAPDEVLILCAHGDAAGIVEQIGEALKGVHHLAVNVSDARALFRVEGPGAREVLAKVAPVDLHPDTFRTGEMRRTRLAQVPAAIWLSGEAQISVICFRSVAKYVFDLLAVGALPGGEVGYF